MSDDGYAADFWGGITRLPGTRGRPKHIPGASSREMVKIGLALGWTNERIAAVLDVSLPTFRNAYKAELKERDVVRDKIELRRFQIVLAKLAEGNVGASKEYSRLLDKNDMMLLSKTEKKKTSERKDAVGKKEQRVKAAQHIPDDYDGIFDRMNKCH